LINFCIVPIEFAKVSDYEKIKLDDELSIDGLLEAIKSSEKVKIVDKTGSFEFVGKLNLSNRDRDILLSSGLLNYTYEKTEDK